MGKKIDIGTLEKLVSEGKVNRARSVLKSLDDNLIVLLLDQAHDDHKAQLFSLLGREQASEIILEISDYSRDVILSHLTKPQISGLVEEMESDDTADLAMSLPDKALKPLLRQLKKEDREEIEQLIQYEEDTAGGLMQLETVMIRKGLAAEEALELVKAKRPSMHINQIQKDFLKEYKASL